MIHPQRDPAARVEFRWREHERHFARQLAESAHQAGRSPSDHARELMKDALTRAEQLEHQFHRIEQELAQLHLQLRALNQIPPGFSALHDTLYELRDDLATYAVKLLTDAGHLDPEAATRWVEDVTRAG